MQLYIKYILFLLTKGLLYIKKNNITATIKKIINFNGKQKLKKLKFIETVNYIKNINFRNSIDYYAYESRKYINKIFLQRNNVKICIQIHLYHIDLINDIIMNLNFMPFPYHCYISTDNEKKIAVIQNEFNKKCKYTDNIIIEKIENRGRDVAAFIEQMRNKINKYDFILHIHTKKSITCNGFRDDWRKYLFKTLLGNVENIYRVFGEFLEDNNLGLIYPEIYPPLLKYIDWDNETQKAKNDVSIYLRRIGVEIKLNDKPEFVAGNMFWARTKAIKKAFESNIKLYDFPIESGQLDFTLAHTIERSWLYLVQSERFKYKKIFNIHLDEVPNTKVDRLKKIKLSHLTGINKNIIIFNSDFIYFYDSWAIDYKNKQSYTNVYMKVNNKIYLTDDHLYSPDIADLFRNNQYNNIKFSFTFPISEMSIGKNIFIVIVVLNDGSTYYESKKIILNKYENCKISF